MPSARKRTRLRPGQGVEGDALPLDAAVARVEQHADAAAAVGQFLAAGDPADVRRQELHAAQRGADGGRLALPGLAAVAGVPDHALVADGPAFADAAVRLADEVDGVQGGVVEMRQVAGAGATAPARRSARAPARTGRMRGVLCSVRIECAGLARLSGQSSQRRPLTRAAKRGVPIELPVAQDAVEGAEGVLQADLLAFLVGAAGVADGDLVDAPGRVPLLGDLGGDLRLEAEAVGLELDALRGPRGGRPCSRSPCR